MQNNETVKAPSALPEEMEKKSPVRNVFSKFRVIPPNQMGEREPGDIHKMYIIEPNKTEPDAERADDRTSRRVPETSFYKKIFSDTMTSHLLANFFSRTADLIPLNGVTEDDRSKISDIMEMTAARVALNRETDVKGTRLSIVSLEDFYLYILNNFVAFGEKKQWPNCSEQKNIWILDVCRYCSPNQGNEYIHRVLRQFGDFVIENPRRIRNLYNWCRGRENMCKIFGISCVVHGNDEGDCKFCNHFWKQITHGEVTVYHAYVLFKNIYRRDTFTKDDGYRNLDPVMQKIVDSNF